MIKYKTYAYKLYPNKKQEEKIKKNIQFSRYVYNKYLEMKIEKYNEYKDYINECKIKRKDPDKNIINEINKLPPLSKFKSKHIFLKEADSIALDTARNNVKNAFSKFYKHISNFPKYKKKSKVKTYMTRYINNNIQIEGNKIRLPKLGFVKTRIYKEIPKDAELTVITIKMEEKSKYYALVTFAYEYEEIKIIKEPIKFNIDNVNVIIKKLNPVGLDFNMEEIIVTNEGYKPGKINKCEEIQNRIDKLRKELNKKKLHSRNWYKYLNRMRRLYREQSKIRKMNLYRISNNLLKEHNLVINETISIKEMAKEVFNRRSLYSASYNKLCRILNEKLNEKGSKIVKVDKYYKSSQICNNCKNINPNLTLKDRVYKCENCGYIEDRDVNAAKNIVAEGARIYIKDIYKNSHIN